MTQNKENAEGNVRVRKREGDFLTRCFVMHSQYTTAELSA
jgi:hypothetical protein